MRSALLLAMLAACADDAGGDSAAPEPSFPELPTSSCGPAYDWQALDEMGELISASREDSLSMSAASIDTVLEGLGWEEMSPVPHGVETWKVRYRTQDRGEAVEATGFVVLPALEERAEVPLVLWLHPTMGFTDDCAPTALGVIGAAYPILWASQGFAVAAPDYLGMAGWGSASGRLHPYVVAEATAVASLDAARAALRLAEQQDSLAVPDGQRLVHWGASEGGFAAMWTDRYQPRYAPELDSAAVLSIVPVTDPPALATYAVGGLSAATAGLAGVLVAHADWYGLDVDSALQADRAAQILSDMQSTCADFTAFDGVEQMSDVFTQDFVDGALAGSPPEPWACTLDESAVHSAPWPRESTAPVLLLTGEQDDLAWAPAAREDVEPLCAQGYEIEHRECAGAQHVAAAIDSLGLQLAWLGERLDGVPIGQSCVIAEPESCE